MTSSGILFLQDFALYVWLGGEGIQIYGENDTTNMI